MLWLLSIIVKMDPEATVEKLVLLDISPTSMDGETKCIWLIAETMSYIWEKRK